MENQYNKLISIIIPIYNVGKKIIPLLEAINLIPEDIFNYLEIIFVNDGSHFNELDIVNNRIKKKFTFINKKNENSALLARKFGLNFAKGEYVWFIDPDDTIKINKINLLIEIIKRKKYDVFLFGIEENYISDNKKKEIKYFNKSKDFNFFNRNKVHTLVYEGLRTCSLCNKIFRVDFIKNNNFNFSFKKYHEDTFLWFQILSKVNTLYYLNEIIYIYNIYKNSNNAMGILSKDRKLSIDLMINAMILVFDYYKKSNYYNNQVLKIINHYIISDLYTTRREYKCLYQYHLQSIKILFSNYPLFKKTLFFIKIKYYIRYLCMLK